MLIRMIVLGAVCLTIVLMIWASIRDARDRKRSRKNRPARKFISQVNKVRLDGLMLNTPQAVQDQALSKLKAETPEVDRSVFSYGSGYNRDEFDSACRTVDAAVQAVARNVAAKDEAEAARVSLEYEKMIQLREAMNSQTDLRNRLGLMNDLLSNDLAALFLTTKNVRLSDQVAEMRKLMDELALTLETRAKHQGDADAFLERKLMSSSESPYRKASGGYLPKYPGNWNDIVAQHIGSPLLNDFIGLAPWLGGPELRRMAAEACVLRNVRDAKIVMAYLNNLGGNTEMSQLPGLSYLAGMLEIMIAEKAV